MLLCSFACSRPIAAGLPGAVDGAIVVSRVNSTLVVHHVNDGHADVFPLAGVTKVKIPGVDGFGVFVTDADDKVDPVPQ